LGPEPFIASTTLSIDERVAALLGNHRFAHPQYLLGQTVCFLFVLINVLADSLLRLYQARVEQSLQEAIAKSSL
jgi:hypothetical protein